MVVITVTGVGYAALLLYVILREDGRARRAWLVGYLALSLSVSAVFALAVNNSQFLGFGAGLPMTALYFINLGFLGALTVSYIGWKWDTIWLALGGGIVLLLLVTEALGLLPVLHAATWQDALAADHLPLPLAIAVLWGLGHAANMAITFFAMTRARLPLHANHLLWWLIVLVTVAVGDAAAAWMVEPLASVGRVLRLAGVAGLVYGVAASQIVDVRNSFRTSVGNGVFVIITAALTLTGIAIAQLLLATLSGLTAFFAVAGIAVLLALVYQALRGFTEKLVRQAVLRVGYDSANVAGQYAQRIARQLRFDELAATAARTLRSSVEASKGGLVLVSPNGASTRADVYPGLGQFPAESFNLSPDSPVLQKLRSTRSPLLQYNIDVGKEFRGMSADEKQWLRSLNMDVFVPVLDGDELSGMLAVGQRISGDPYRHSELELMMAIADQTSVALNNARLFENMRALNEEMKSLNTNLLATNERLEEM
ncbi:MAG: GAF domain-containing protein, partial [Anaerolineales bacterium]